MQAARAAGIPAVVSFTVETDGRLLSGQSRAEVLEQVDEETDGAAAYFMVNCAHPTQSSTSWSRPHRGSSGSVACAQTPGR